jgi:hypothetical protein
MPQNSQNLEGPTKKPVESLRAAKSISELQEIWAAHSKEWARVDPVSLRRIIAAKDLKKLELAQELDDAMEAKRIAASVLKDMFCETGRLKPAWEQLADSDLIADEVADLTEAIFLHWLRKLDCCDQYQAMYLWDEYESAISKRLPRDAMAVLNRAYFKKIRSESIAAYKGAPGV